MNPNLEAALEYAAKGRAIFPVYGKVPATKRGFHDATTDIDQVTKWWTEHPNWGIGCPIPEGFIVVDVDAKAGGLETLRQLEETVGVPETRAALTGGGGLHLWFRTGDQTLRQGAGILGPGIDTRVAGRGYVVLPPSLHPSGVAYEWDITRPTADLPEWMAERLRAIVKPSLSPALIKGLAVPLSDDDTALAYKRVEGAADTVRRAPEGTRNETLNAMSFIAGKMIHHGVTHQDAFDIMYAAGIDAEQGELTEGTVNSGLGAGYDAGPDPDHGVGVSKSIILPKKHTSQKEQSSQKREVSERGRRRLTRASEIETLPVDWLWNGVVPIGEICLTPGYAGVGKSTFHSWLIAQITTGRLPGIYYSNPRVAFIAAREDSWQRTIAPRLIAAGADMDMVFRYDVEEEEGDLVKLSLPKHYDQFEQDIIDYEAVVVSIDPLLSTIAADLDSFKSSDMRSALEPLQALADRTGCVMLGNAHFNKSVGSDPVLRISGSAAFGEVTRAAIAFAEDLDEGDYVMSPAKNSLGPLAPSLSYDIEPFTITTSGGRPSETSRIVFTGETGRTVRQLLSPTRGTKKASTNFAKEMIMEIVIQPSDWTQIKGALAEQGISEHTGRRARDELRESGEIVLVGQGTRNPKWARSIRMPDRPEPLTTGRLDLDL